MTEIKQRIGIMGGTFDPIHMAHLMIAEEAMDAFKLDKVLFIPTAQPPHKRGKRIAPAKHRLAMVQMATCTNPRFFVSTIELEREGPSYSWLTIQELKQHYGDSTELFFITGSDMINDLYSWYHPKDLVENCHFIGTTRPEVPFELDNLIKVVGKDLVDQKIHELVVPRLELSSTDIRQRVAEGKSIRYLVPDIVEAYIAKEGLYR